MTEFGYLLAPHSAKSWVDYPYDFKLFYGDLTNDGKIIG